MKWFPMLIAICVACLLALPALADVSVCGPVSVPACAPAAVVEAPAPSAAPCPACARAQVSVGVCDSAVAVGVVAERGGMAVRRVAVLSARASVRAARAAAIVVEPRRTRSRETVRTSVRVTTR